VKVAIPIALGDNYLGYRVVGTVTNLFSKSRSRPGALSIWPSGRSFESGLREAVVGSFVAPSWG
jgi:putative ABC transport system permease protein